MARMTFGPWFRPGNMAGFIANEFYDVTATCGHPNWIRPENVEQAKWLPSPQKWVRPDGSVLEYRPAYVRRRDWAHPLDAGVSDQKNYRNGIDMALNDDGSATINMTSYSEVMGTITIAAADLETVAQWFTKAVEANKQ
jgi:hypothetical protein